MRPAVFAACSLLLLSAGCGYVGPVVPPSPEVPAPVTNLSVAERGDQLVISFSTPAYTTDAIGIRKFSKIDLRIGPAPDPFNLNKWEAGAKTYEVPPPPLVDPDDPHSNPVSRMLPASEWQGQRIAVAVRTAVKEHGHVSPWSNVATVEVVEPLQTPAIACDATPQGYKLTWPETRPDVKYHVLRQGPSEKTSQSVGIAEKNEFVDTSAQWDTPYTYTVVARLGAAEGLPSNTVSVNHPDTFPPSVPAGVTALAGPDSVELTWSRSPESDLKFYRVYRALGDGPFEPFGEPNLPTFSDRKVEHGKKYRYAVSAIDAKGNESQKSPVAEVTF